LLAAIVGTAIIGAFIAGFLPKLVKKHELRDNATNTEHALPRVEVIAAHSLTTDRALELPGTIQPLEETTIYPRANGYIRRWLVDIGDLVKEGQALAEIDTPELDAQIEQARADLAQAEAGKIRAETNAELSGTERARYEALTPAGVASKQELEQRRAQAKVDEANIKVANATIASQEASLHRLTQLKSFARVVAPFGGTITARTVDRGSLVGTSPATPLFKLAATDPVRIFIQVPQDVAPSIKTGVTASITVREFGNRVFAGTVSRAAGALDDTTRTMTTEVRVPNPKHELLPGMYVRVAISLPTPHRLFEIPATALYADAQGTRIGIVDGQNKIAFRKVGIERDLGSTIEIASGLDGTERILRIANAALAAGTLVEILELQPKGDELKK
jgi:RND family efflux transporter MFP subunit